MRALNGVLLTGRYRAAVEVQWQRAGDDVRTQLDDMDPAYDAPVAGEPIAQAALPTAPGGERRLINGLPYTQHWYVGWCWQPGSGQCGNEVRSGVRYLRAVVPVNWPHQRCPAAACWYVASTLVTGVLIDPVFARRAPP